MSESLSQSEVRTLMQGGYVAKKRTVVDRIEIVLPLPPKQTHPNKRCHWRAKMKPKQKQRHDAFCAACDARARARHDEEWQAAEVHTTWYLARKNDQDNLLSWGKATWDGIADAGVVTNDRNFIFMPPVQITGKEARGARKLVVTIVKRRLEA